MEIEAGQLIYTSVDRSISPTGKAGFQPLYISSGWVTPRETLAVVERLSFFPLNPEAPLRRRQFFVVGADKIIIVNTVNLPGIKNEFGKGGIYLAHCLIITRNDFAQIANDPFAILNSSLFIEDYNSALSLGNPTSQHINTVKISIGKAGIQRLSNNGLVWSVNNAYQLATLASNASSSLGQRKVIQLIGSTEEIEDSLAISIKLTYPPQRLDCTFDTYHNKNLAPLGSYWAVGLPKLERSGSAAIPIELSNPKWDNLDLVAPLEYRRWLQFCLKRYSLIAVVQESNTIALLSDILSGQKMPAVRISSLSELSISSFYEANTDEIQEKFLSIIGNELGSKLTSQIRSLLLTRLHEARTQLTVIQQGLISGKILEEILFQYVLTSISMPLTGKELRELSEFAARINSYRVITIITLWQGKKKEFQQQIDLLEDDDYLSLAQAYVNHQMPPPSLILTKTKLHLLAKIDLSNLSEKYLITFLESVLALGGGNSLQIRREYLSQLSLNGLQQLAKSVQNSRDAGSFDQLLTRVLFEKQARPH